MDTDDIDAGDGLAGTTVDGLTPLDGVPVAEAVPPVRAWSVTVRVGGDTREDAVRLLRSFADDFAAGSNGPISHGGCSAGGSMSVAYDAAKTADVYQAELLAYLARNDRPGG